MSKYLLIFLCLFGAFPLYSQEPEEVEITLPPIQAEAEDLLIERLSVDLPQTTLLPPAYDLLLPLPEFVRPAPSDIAFDLPLPGTDADAPLPQSQESVFFSEGIIGLGSMDHMLGDLSLYKVGREPRFSLHFYHTRRDGYQFAEAGSGFFNQQDGIEGRFSFITDPVSAETEGAYRKETEGLQQQGPFDSVSWSLLSGGGSLELSALKPFIFSAGLSARSANALLTAESPLRAEEITLNPVLGASLVFPRFVAKLGADYAYYVRTGPADASLHRILAFLELRLPVVPFLEAGGRAGVYWFTSNPIFVPFSLFLNLRPVPSLRIGMEGGLKSGDESWYALWKQYPLVWLSDLMPASRSWYADLDFDWYILPDLHVKTGAGYEYVLDAVSPSADIDPVFGMYGTEKISAHRISLPFSLDWDPLEWLSFSLGGRARLLGQFLHENRFEGSFEMDMHTLNGVFGGSLRLGLPVLDTVQVPVLNLGFFVRPIPGVRFTLEGEDLLCPVIENGRRSWGDFRAPGFQVSFKTNISL